MIIEYCMLTTTDEGLTRGEGKRIVVTPSLQTPIAQLELYAFD
jgi:hypothetical protein